MKLNHLLLLLLNPLNLKETLINSNLFIKDYKTTILVINPDIVIINLCKKDGTLKRPSFDLNRYNLLLVIWLNETRLGKHSIHHFPVAIVLPPHCFGHFYFGFYYCQRRGKAEDDNEDVI